MEQELLQEDAAALANRLELIDRLADEFEQAWTPGSRTLLTRFLSNAAPSVRPALAVELVKLELELSAKRADPVDLPDYLVRVPHLLGPTGWPDDELVRYFDRLPRKRSDISFPATHWDGSSGFSLVRRRSIALRPTFYDVIDRRAGSAGNKSENKALLVIYPPMVREQVEAVTRMIQKWEAVKAAGIPKVRELGSIGGCLYVLQDPPAGPTLVEESVTWEEAARRSIKAAAAVSEMHRAGLAHGLLSPETIVVQPDGTIQLLGLPVGVQGLRQSPSASDPRLGWLCPEDVWNIGKGNQAATDCFAMGATLYHQLAGQPLYAGSDPKAVLAKAMACAMDETPLINRRVPRPLREVCRKALQRNPENRYANLDAFASDLERAVHSAKVARTLKWVVPMAAVAVGAICYLLLK